MLGYRISRQLSPITVNFTNIKIKRWCPADIESEVYIRSKR